MASVGSAFGSAFGLNSNKPKLNSFGGPYGTNIGSAANPFKPPSVANSGYSQPSYNKQGTSSTNYTYKPPYQNYSQTNSWGGAYGTNQGAPSYSSGSGGGGSSGGGGGGGGSSSGGGGGGGGGDGGGGGAVATQMAAPAPVMETIVIPDAKADDQYQKTVADLARAKADFLAQQKLTRDQYDRQFGDAKTRMGFLKQDKASRFAKPVGLAEGAGSDEVWSLDPNQGAYGEALYGNENDFAGRGIIRSGLFAQAQNNIGNDFTDRLNTLLQGRKESVDTQDVAKNAFTGQQDATDKAALQDAVNKIAAKYSIQLSEVPMGSTKEVYREKVG